MTRVDDEGTICLGSRRRGVERVGCAAGELRFVHRSIGLFQQDPGIGPGRTDRDADACCDA